VLQRRLLELSRALHPDRFVKAEAHLRQASLERMGLVNEAYRQLSDREALREFLFAEAGFSGKRAQEPEDLELASRWFELEEEAQQAHELAQFEGELLNRSAAIEARLKHLEELYDRGEDPTSTLAEMHLVVQSRNTLKSLARDVERLKARLG
jgi:molecular chaperone HscB